MYHCRSIFSQIKKYLERATKQVKRITPRPHSKIKLSRSERAKWPFLQFPFNELRTDLRDSKTNLLLMVAVANLAIVRKESTGRRIDEREQTEMKATIVRLQRAGTLKVSSLDDNSEEEKDSRVKRLVQKIGFWNGGRKKELEDDVDGNKGGDREKHAGTTAGARQVSSSEAMREQRKPNQPPIAATNSPLDNVSAGNSKGFIKTDIARSATPNAKTALLILENATASCEGGRESGLDSLTADVPIQPLASEYVSQNHPPTKTLYEPRIATYESSNKTKKHPDLLNKSKKHQHEPPKEETPKESEVINVDEPKPSSSSTKAKDVHEFLQAWTFSALPGLSSGVGNSVDIIELTLPETEIRARLQKQEAEHRSPLETLHKPNNYQRHLMLAHSYFGDSTLLHVDAWHKERIPTVFGQLDIVTLIWITSSTQRREGPIGIGALFREKRGLPSKPKETLNFKDAVGRKFTFPYDQLKSWEVSCHHAPHHRCTRSTAAEPRL